MKHPSDIDIERVLNGRSSPRKANEVAEWIASDDAKAELSERMDNDFRALDGGGMPLCDGGDSACGLNEVLKTVRKKKVRMILSYAAAVATPFVLLAALALDVGSLLGGGIFGERSQLSQTVPDGERSTVVFQEGTRVWLNSGSVISYPDKFPLKERRISLDGEGYFEVASNKRRPFVIDIGDVNLKVLGTAFNVKSYHSDRNVDIALVSGSVEFFCGGGKYELHPAQRLVYDKSSGTVRIYDDALATDSGDWRDNVIRFQDTPMGDVIPVLERWFNVRFAVADPEVYKSAFTLKAASPALEDLLSEMEHISDLRFSKDGGVVTVSVKR